MDNEAKSAFLQKVSGLITDSGLSQEISVDENGRYLLQVTSGDQESLLQVSVSGNVGESKVTQKDALVEKIKALGCSDLKIGITSKKGPGDKMGVIADADKICINGEFCEGSANIEHKDGEVILLDLWATWCPPCQAPMGHNQEMLAKGKAEWEGKVRIIGLGTDQGKDALKTRITEKKWTKVEHYHVSNGKCQASANFGAGGIPHCILVDTSGTIVWKGHPSSIPLEQRIDELLAGKNSFDSPAGGGAAEKDGPPMGNMSGEQAASLKKMFDETAATIKADEELKKNAQGMQVIFGIVTNGQFCSESNSIKYNAQLHTIAAPGRQGENNQDCKDSLKKHTEAARALAKELDIMSREILD